MELVDIPDLKSVDREIVRVQVPPLVLQDCGATVAHRTFNPLVVGSNPSSPTRKE